MKEMALLEEKNPFKKILDSVLRSSMLSFKVTVPNDLYLRSDTLCDDITRLYDEDIDYSQCDLIVHIFEDFIEQIRRHDTNVGSIYNRLIVRRQQFPLINNQPLLPNKSSNIVHTKIPREYVYRAEVLLSDLARFTPNHSLQVEDLVEIVYLDFLLEYQNGRRTNVITEILEILDED